MSDPKDHLRKAVEQVEQDGDFDAAWRRAQAPRTRINTTTVALAASAVLVLGIAAQQAVTAAGGGLRATPTVSEEFAPNWVEPIPLRFAVDPPFHAVAHHIATYAEDPKDFWPLELARRDTPDAHRAAFDLRVAQYAARQGDFDGLQNLGRKSGLPAGALLAAEVHIVDLEPESARAVLHGFQTEGPVEDLRRSYLAYMGEGRVMEGIGEVSALFRLGEVNTACEHFAELLHDLTPAQRETTRERSPELDACAVDVSPTGPGRRLRVALPPGVEGTFLEARCDSGAFRERAWFSGGIAILSDVPDQECALRVDTKLPSTMTFQGRPGDYTCEAQGENVACRGGWTPEPPENTWTSPKGERSDATLRIESNMRGEVVCPGVGRTEIDGAGQLELSVHTLPATCLFIAGDRREAFQVHGSTTVRCQTSGAGLSCSSGPAGVAPPRGQLHLGSPLVIGLRPDAPGMTTEKVAADALAPLMPRLQACYATALASDDSIAGRLMPSVALNPDGSLYGPPKSLGAELQGDSEALEACILDVLSDYRAPPLGEGNTAGVTFPMIFTPN